LAHTKTKGEVSGGGKKPWRQKGTGRARAGSIRSPLWRGGGVIFGPRRDRNFKVKINKKTKRLAFLMALSEKVKNKGLLLLENFNLETPKTKLVSGLLKKLPIKSKRVLIVFPKRQETKNMSLAARNITNVEQADLGSLNLLDLLKSGTILTVKDTVDYWHKTYKQ
jgi:large subunit ribosomal protein L4